MYPTGKGGHRKCEMILEVSKEELLESIAKEACGLLDVRVVT